MHLKGPIAKKKRSLQNFNNNIYSYLFFQFLKCPKSFLLHSDWENN